ncbi:MAG: DUF4031 domain-containing protein [Brachybacterium sp.]|nr:DUF4031 domain-containing protein [Brachybacterium sp.]
MTLYADTPRWPRHGMLWGHLISDHSLEELHAGAERAGLHPRSFDLDHYDWPEQARRDLLAADAVMVDARELTRRLIASGLRIPGRDRPTARRERTRREAFALGLPEVPRDLITGLIGHVDPLPADAPDGAFRLSRDEADEPPRIEATGEAGREAAHAFLTAVDALSRQRRRGPWIGQVLAGF